MIFTLPNLLTDDELAQILPDLAKADFIDGALAAGWDTRPVKHNQELPPGELQQTLIPLVEQALRRNVLFQIALRPRQVHSLRFNRYQVGMAYGDHIDDPFMGEGLWRSDVSFTLFLSNPEDYDGGELVIQMGNDERAYKLSAGSMLAYPSSVLHRVETVRQGTRLAVVGWVQSLIRDAAQREVLFDLETARRSLFAREGKTAEFDLLSKSIANLLRKWAE